MTIKYLIYIGVFLLLGACSNSVIYYNPDQKRSIYFDWDLSKYTANVVPDTVFFSFAIYEEKEVEYCIPVKVIGMPINEDQYFELEIVEDSTTAEYEKHYEFGMLNIPKNEVNGIFSLKLNRTEDIMNHPVFLYLKFKENDYFKPMENDHYFLSITDGKLAKPAWWSDYYLGEYNNNNDKLYLKILENFWGIGRIETGVLCGESERIWEVFRRCPNSIFSVTRKYDLDKICIEAGL